MTDNVIKTLPFAPHVVVRVGLGNGGHAALSPKHFNGDHASVTVCGSPVNRARKAGENDVVTCKRCLGKLPKIDRQNRRDSYYANVDAELDAFSYGASAEVATAWRETFHQG